jgi:hypothetical protein
LIKNSTKNVQPDNIRDLSKYLVTLANEREIENKNKKKIVNKSNSDVFNLDNRKDEDNNDDNFM